MWLYATGFPKGRACLKPAWEPIIVARKPGPMRELGIEECRIAIEGSIDPLRRSYNQPGNKVGCGHVFAGGRSGDYTGAADNPHPDSPRHNASGRYPANLILDEEAGRLLDQQTGMLTSGANPTTRSGIGYGSSAAGQEYCDAPRGSDSGGASRFFYCAKASRAERNAGCEGMPLGNRVLNTGSSGRTMVNGEWVETHSEPVKRANHHPTVKPVALMCWLVKLVARPGELVLDPFTGSGSTGVACVTEGREFVGIEREADYIAIAKARIAYAEAQQRLPV
jgi:site-specific DNA-methyltransferase (adenine-specific)